MVNTQPQPSATISLRMYVLVVIAVRKDPETWDTDFSGGLTDRGYTMHSLFRPFGKHLDDFGLINMNGRVYDPLLGRFLSPDNHIQAPDNPQNYNRYAYALNNPLKYTDPSGEFLIESIMIAGFINATVQTVSGNVNSRAGFWGAFAIGAASGAAGGVAGQAVAKAVGTIGFIGGALTGASSGFTSSFVLGAGNSLMSGASFGTGLTSGLKMGISGALSGGIIGGLSSGISALKHGGDFWSGEGATYDVLAAPGSGEKIEVGEGMEYSNKYAKQFSDEYFGEDIEGLENLFADGSIPDGYTKNGDMVFNKKGAPVGGSTRYLGTGKGSNVYLYKSSFISQKRLFLNMGHEYIHVGHFNKGLINFGKSEHAAMQWHSEQARRFKVLPFNRTYKTNYTNSKYYDETYDYKKFMLIPIINVL